MKECGGQREETINRHESDAETWAGQSNPSRLRRDPETGLRCTVADRPCIFALCDPRVWPFRQMLIPSLILPLLRAAFLGNGIGTGEGLHGRLLFVLEGVLCVAVLTRR